MIRKMYRQSTLQVYKKAMHKFMIHIIFLFFFVFHKVTYISAFTVISYNRVINVCEIHVTCINLILACQVVLVRDNTYGMLVKSTYAVWLK